MTVFPSRTRRSAGGFAQRCARLPGRPLSSGFVLLALWLWAGLAQAIVVGEPHVIYRQHRVFGDAVSAGNTLMQSSIADPAVNSVLLAQSGADVRGVPFDAELVGAYLFWSGAIEGQPDNRVTLTAADGTRFNDIQAERCTTVNRLGGFFACRADVSAQVRAHPGGSRYNGRYTVGDVSASPGRLVPDGQGGVRCAEPQTCQAKYAAWSLVLVYDAASARNQRDVFLYDGFRNLDETDDSPGIDQFDIRGFDFPLNGRASLSYFATEGDLFLGVPPQDTDPLFRCDTCFDFLEINGTKLSDGLNPPNNLFNSSTALGVDLEGFDVSNLLRPGDASARIRVGSGDGIVDRLNPDPAGGGESFFLSYVLLNVDRNAPNFRRDGSRLSVVPDEGAPRERVVITLTVANEGTLDALNARARLALPPGLTYLPGSLRVDGADPVPGEEAINPLAAGFNLGRIPFQGANTRTITLRATIDAAARPGQRIISQAFLRADGVDEVPTNEAILTIVGGLDLGTITKTVADLDGDGRFVPGEVLRYRILIPNPNARDVVGVNFVDVLPPALELVDVITPNGVDRSNPAANRVEITDLFVPGSPGGGVTITILARLKNPDALVAAGIPAAQINGFAVANQALIEAAGEQRPSDDPSTAAVGDATVFRISSAIDISGPGTRKLAEDVNGGFLEPGDTVRFTLRIENTGSAAAEVFINDPLPPALTGCAITSPAPTLSCAGDRLQGVVTVPAGGSVAVVFTSTVRDGTPNGTQIVNVANVRALADPAQVRDVSSPPLRVFFSPALGDTAKLAPENGDGVALPGSRIRYQIRVPNSGNQPATQVVITDALQFAFTAVAPQNGGVFDPDTNTITWRIAEIRPGDTAVVGFEAQLPPAVPDGTVLSNQARVVSLELPAPTPSDDPATGALDDPTRLVVRSQPRLRIAKAALTAVPGQVRPGEVYEYRLTVRNDGTDDARQVVVRDPLPPGTFAAVEAPGGRVVDGVVTFDAASTPALALLAVGAQVELTVRVTLGPAFAADAVVENQAEGRAQGVDARWPSDDPTTAAVEDATRLRVQVSPAYGHEKTVTDLNGGAVQPGDRLRYTLTVQNTGDALLDPLEIDDPVPAGLTAVAPADGGRLANGRVRYTLAGALAPGARRSVTFEATVAADAAPGLTIANQASLAAAGLAPVPSDDPTTPAAADPTVVTVVRQPDLSTSTKRADRAEAQPGEVITYTIEVINSGTEAAAGVTVEDPIPAPLSVEDAGGGVVGGGQIRWVRFDLPPGGRRTLTWRGRLPRPAEDGLRILNQATVRAGNLEPVVTDDPGTAEPDDPAVVVVRARPVLTLTKGFEDLDGLPTRPGDPIAYVLTLTNTGGADAANVTVEDPLPAELFEVQVPPPAVVAGGTVRWPVGALGLDAPTRLRITARVRAPLANGTRVSNQARVQAAVIEPTLSDDPTTAEPNDPTAFQVISAADFTEAQKTVRALDEPPFRPGGRVEYRLRFRNGGDDAARAAVVRDAIPANLTVDDAGGGVLENGNLVWPVGDVAPGAVVERTFTARIASPLDDGTVISNRAEINAEGFAAPFRTDDPGTPEVDATRFTVQARAVATLLKRIEAVGGLPLRPGDAFAYVLTVGNTGDAVLRDLQVLDPLPAGLDAVAVAAPARLDGQTVRWPVPPVNPGATAILRISARVPVGTPDGTRFANQATAGDLRSDDPTTAAPADPTVFDVVDDADLSASTKTVEGTFAPGSEVVYQLTILNRGTRPATGVVVRDPIPAGLTVLATEPVVPVVAGALTWNLGVLEPEARRVLRIVARIDEAAVDGTRVANQATVTAAETAPALTDDPATERVDDATAFVVVEPPALVLEKRVSDVNGGDFAPGDAVVFTLRLQNTSPRALPEVEVIDPLDPNLTEVEAVGGAVADGIATFTVRDLAPGQIRDLELRARIAPATPDGTELTNQFGARPAGAPEFLLSDTVRFTVRAAAAVFEKTAEPLLAGGFAPGTALRYTLRVRNPGANPLRDVRVSDAIPAGRLERVEPEDGGVFNANTGRVEWRPDTTPALAEIPPGGEVLLHVRVTIPAGLAVGEIILNQATLTAAGLAAPLLSDDPTTPAVADPTAIVVQGGPVWAVTKDIIDPDRTAIGAGTVLTYRLTVANRGSQAGLDPVLVDPLPAEVIYEAGSTRMNGQPVPDVGGRAPVQGGLTLQGLRGGPARIEPGDQARVEFAVRVRPEVASGTRVTNQAELRDKDRGVVPSDDPTTAAAADPTAFVVGGGAGLSPLTKTFSVIGVENAQRAQVGQIIEWRLVTTHLGGPPLNAVRLEDPIPARTRYVPGSLTVDGQPVTDLPDQDPGAIINGLVLADVTTLAPGASFTVTFRTEVLAGPSVENTGTVAAQGLPPRPSNRVVVPVGEAPSRSLALTKEVTDPNGAPTLAGETLQYALVVENTGTLDLASLSVVDDLPPGLVFGRVTDVPPDATVEFDPAPAGAFQNGRLRIRNLAVAAGARRTLRFEARVDPRLPGDRRICNTAQVQSPEAPPADAEAACVDAVVRFSEINGVAYQDRDRDGAFDAEADVAFVGMRVALSPADDPDAAPVVEATSDANGQFRLDRVLPGAWRMRVFSSTNTQLAVLDQVVVEAGRALKQDVRIEPMGRVYDSVEGDLLDGAEVFLYRDEDLNDDPLDEASRRRRVLVPPEELEAPSQQGQRTAHGGIYRFGVRRPGRYLIEVLPPGPSGVSPSVLVPAAPGYAFTDDPLRRVVVDPLPRVEPDADRTWFLAFESQGLDDQLRHNHLPIDPLSSLIDIDKRSSRRQVTIGEIITWQVDLVNRSPVDLVYDPRTTTGGVILQDVMPKGLKYVAGSAVLNRVGEGREVALAADDPAGARILRFGQVLNEGGRQVLRPMNLRAGEHLRLRYQSVVGADAQPRRTYKNRVVLLADGNVPISRTAEAEVLVAADVDFDQGLVIGKVFCDADGDGQQSKGETGLAGARLYMDHGYFAVTDSEGKFHFKDLDPGTHAVKIDRNTLLPGAKLTTDELRTFHVTRGLPVKVGFGVTCPTERVAGAQLELAGQGVETAFDALRRRATTVIGDAEALRVQVGTAPAVTVATPKIGLRLDGKPLDAPDLVPATGGVQGELSFGVELPAGAQAQRWALWVGPLDEEGAVVARGEGNPPASIPWDQRGPEGNPWLRTGQVYGYRLELVGADGGLAGSPIGVFGVAALKAPLPPLIATLPADGLTAQGPDRAQRAALKNLAEQLQTLDGTLVVEVHTDTQSAPLTAVRDTRRAAEALVEFLVRSQGLPRDRLEPVGAGNGRPVVPNLGEANRARNRRIELRHRRDLAPGAALTAPGSEAPSEASPAAPPSVPVEDPWADAVGGTSPPAATPGANSGANPTGNATAGPPGNFTAGNSTAANSTAANSTTGNASAAPPASLPRPTPRPIVRAGREEAVPGDDGAFALTTEVPPEGVVEVYVRAADGRRAVVVVPVRPAPPAERGLVRRVDVQGTLPGGLTVGGAATPVRGLGVVAEGPTGVGLDAEGRLARPVEFRLQAPAGVVRWRFAVAAPDGEVVFSEGGAGSPPARLTYTDPRPRPAGFYEYRLTARLADHAVGQSAPGRLTVAPGPQADAVAPPVVSGGGGTGPFKLSVEGAPVSPGPDGGFFTTAEVRGDAGLLLQVTDPSGAQAVFFVAPPREAAGAPSAAGSLSSSAASAVGGPAPGAALDAPAVAGGPIGRLPPQARLAAPGSVLAPEQTGAANLVLAPEQTSGLGGTSGDPYRKVDDLPRTGTPAPTIRGAATGPGPRQPLPPEARDELARFGRDELLRTLGPVLTGAPLASAGTVLPNGAETVRPDGAPTTAGAEGLAALDLEVALPPAGAELGAPSLAVRGRTRPGNRITLNGEAIPVDAEGRFSGVATLPRDGGEVEVAAIDPEGNRGVIRRPYAVRDHAWFLLALGESQLGTQGAELAGVEQHTSTTLGDSVYIHGRAAVYFKGEMKGDQLFKGLFERLEATVHLDTARRREFETYFRQMFDPETFYPVYGDSAQVVKDANTRGMLYVLVKADRNTLEAGNFRTGIRGIELLNYDRTLYGAAVQIDDSTELGSAGAPGAPGAKHTLKHQARAFVSDTDIAERHAYVELRGTGGSLYYLPHRELVEGSERVYLVERDKIANIERRKVILTRDVDYTVRYTDGRILMKSPVPSVTLDGFGALAQPNRGEVLDGHPVYLSIEYDHRDLRGTGDTAMGAHARETYNDNVSVGAGYVRENRGLDGPAYQLWGADLRLKHQRRTRFEAELAQSRSSNATNLLSQDGGLSFKPFNGRDGARAEGTSFLLRGGLELDDLIGKGDTDHWYTEGYWQYLAPGFYSGGTIQQQGVESYGAMTQYVLNENHRLRLQHDGTAAADPLNQGEGVFRSYRRDVTRAGHVFQDGKLQIDSEFVHTAADEGDGLGPLVTDVVVSGARYQLNDRWTLLAEQEVVVRGDRRIHQSTGDLFATTVGARYRVSEALQLELTESVRWSGDNATQLGARTQIDDRHTLYGQQRFVNRVGGGVDSTTVLGGEERWGRDKSGRLFGEYQLESGQLGERNRAVMGVGKRTAVLTGLTMDVAYQRSQVVGGGMGEFSQDAVSLGLEWLDSERLKVSGRYELRYDDNDESAGRRDRAQFLALNAGSLKLHRDVTLMIRANLSHTWDLGLDATEAELIEGSIGLAWRPVDHDWVAVLVKYTKRYEQRPTDLLVEVAEREEADVVSVMPIVELPLGFQLVEKFAWKRNAVRTGPVPAVAGHTLLWINRVNFHLTNTWDLGGEYRFLRSTLAQNQLHGALVEVNYIIQKTVRLGLGYNFSRFSDDEFARLDEDHGGAFLRVVAHY